MTDLVYNRPAVGPIATDADRREEWRTRELGGVPVKPHPHRRMILHMLGRLDFNSVLELGCGSGENLRAIARESLYRLDLYGVDINLPRVLACQEACKDIASCVSVKCGDERNLPSADLVLCDAVCLIYEDPSAILDALQVAAKRWLVLSEWHDDGRGTFRGDRVEDGPDYWVHDFTERLGKSAYSWPYSKPDWPGERCGNWHAYGWVMAWRME